MSAARIAILGIVVSAVFAGAALYYLQVYAYYVEVTAEVAEVQMTSVVTGAPEPILFENYKGIDSDSSPIRYRACFETPLSQAMLTETYQTYTNATPLVAPGWFDCFDAVTIGDAIDTGEAIAFMGVENITYGIDQVVAVFPDGRGYVWQQINPCGAVVFNGDPAPDGCPPVPENLK
jgi:hypothetical protein